MPHCDAVLPRFPRQQTGMSMLLGLILAQVGGHAVAQNADAQPRYGSTSLEWGFADDPFTVQIDSPGGDDSASAAGSDCYGYIEASRPDFRLTYKAGIHQLGILVDSDVDTTLVVSDPDGVWHCNDDSWSLENANPGIMLTTPRTGDYNIWIGTFLPDESAELTVLAITEVDEPDWLVMDLGVRDMLIDSSYDADGNIVFGDDQSMFANDGECDDDRFSGIGMASVPVSEDRFHDASDCRVLFDAGSLSLFGEVYSAARAPAGDTGVEITTIDFGNNTSLYANDGECDDPRFEGPGSAGYNTDKDLMRDASDCRMLFDAGLIELAN